MITIENYDRISEAVDSLVSGFSQLLKIDQTVAFDKKDIHALANMFVLSLCVQNDQLDEFPEILTEENMHVGDEMQFALDKLYEEEQEQELDYEEDDGLFDMETDETGNNRPVLKINSVQFIKEIN